MVAGRKRKRQDLEESESETEMEEDVEVAEAAGDKIHVVTAVVMAAVPDQNELESELKWSESEPEVEAGVKDRAVEAAEVGGDEIHVVNSWGGGSST